MTNEWNVRQRLSENVSRHLVSRDEISGDNFITKIVAPEDESTVDERLYCAYD